MDIERKHFYVTLFSNASIHLYPNNTLAVFTTHLAHPIDLGTSSSEWEVGLCEISYGGSPKGVEVSGMMVLVYCDLIAPQFVADQNLRTLRTIIFPVKGEEHRFLNIYYLPVEKRVFQDITIQMRLTDGSPVPLEADTVPVKVVLHLRRVV
jgi:hypothetical protein